MLPKFQIQSVILAAFLWAFCSLPTVARSEKPNPDIYKRGMDLLYSGKPDEAKALLEEELNKTGSELALFGLGWIHYYHRHHDKAEEVFQFILNGMPSPSRKASCQQVLGWVYFETGRHELAEQYFQEAVKGYQALDKPSEVLKIRLAMAEVNFTLGREEKLDDLFNKCMQLSVDQKYKINKGYLYTLKARREFLRNNFKGALYFSKAGLAEYRKLKEHEAGTAGALADVAFFMILDGEIEAGEKANYEAVEVFKRLNLESHIQWTRLNDILLNKCRSKPYQGFVDEVKGILERQNDELLKKGLDFVLSWECQP